MSILIMLIFINRNFQKNSPACTKQCKKLCAAQKNKQTNKQTIKNKTNKKQTNKKQTNKQTNTQTNKKGGGDGEKYNGLLAHFICRVKYDREYAYLV